MPQQCRSAPLWLRLLAPRPSSRRLLAPPPPALRRAASSRRLLAPPPRAVSSRRLLATLLAPPPRATTSGAPASRHLRRWPPLVDPAPSTSSGRRSVLLVDPDSLVLLILNKVEDVRSLGRCSAVTKHSLAQVLWNFMHTRNLRMELPSGDVGTEEGVLLKWRAEFGSTLQNCVILGGTQVDHKPVGAEHEPSSEDNGSMPESFYTNGGLKLRVVWTISSLIAASTRHYLLRSIIKDHPTLASLVLTDADGQGTLCMGAEQLKEFRENQLSA